MKKIRVFSMLGILLPFALGAAVKTVTWSLPADWEANVEYGESNGRLVIRGNDFGYPSDPVGAPALPFIPISVAVPKGATYSNCTVEATWEEVKVKGESEQRLRPSVVQQPVIIGETAAATPEDAAYFGAAAYPARPESVGGIETSASEATIMAWVTPYRWNGQAGKLEKAKTITITFTYVAPRLRAAMQTAAADKVDMVIISPPAFTNLWPAYVSYRKETHPDLNIIIKNTAEIYSEYASAGGDDAFKIHKYLEAMYDGGNGIKYAILGAGCGKGSYDRTKEIPIRDNVAAGSKYYASDLYYSCMETKGGQQVWDYGGDGTYLGYAKSGGGWACDSAAQVDWTPDIACFRFPVRENGSVIGIASKTTRTYTAKEQIDGLVTKLKRIEGGNFTGGFKAGYSGKITFSSWNRGNTSDLIAGECNFFDWATNPWSASHSSDTDDWEYYARYDIKQYLAANRPLSYVWCGSSDSGTGGNIYGNDMEMDVHVSHGQKQTAAPFEAYNFFTTSKIQKILNFSFSCQTGHLDTNDFDSHGNLCFAEACVLNPNGGALVTMNNTREGWGAAGDYHEMLSLLIQVCMSEAYFSSGAVTAGEAFVNGHKRVLNRAGSIGPGTTMAGCYVEMNTMGDPLVRLADYPAAESFAGTLNGKFVKDATITATTSVDGNSGAMNLAITPATTGETVKVNGGYTFKVFNKVTVNGGNLQWDATGGVAKNGIEFAGAKGDLTFTGEKIRYFGTKFTNVGSVRVNGSGVTLDFDRNGGRGITALSFTGGGSKSNALRSRAGGVFADTLTIPVSNSLVVLNTLNVGGVADMRAKPPLFALTNATLRIDENPHWGTEFLSRSVTMNNSTINVNYQSVGFGPAVNNAGFDLDALEGTNKILGNYDAEISGQFKVNVSSNASLAISIPLTKSSRTGSLLKVGDGTLELRASNAFQGGITVREGTLVAGKQSPSALAAGEVTVESNATLKLESIPLASITKLTVKAGGKLILPGLETTASYDLVDPLKSSLSFEEGALIYNENNLDTPLNGDATADGKYKNMEGFISWNGHDGAWVKDGSLTNWTTFVGEDIAYDDTRSVQFLDSDDKSVAVAVCGAMCPGDINFANRVTAYRFTNGVADASIALGTLYTVGETTFDTKLALDSKLVVNSGKTTVNDLSVANVTVAPEGAFVLNGTLSSAIYCSKVELNVTAVNPKPISLPFLGTKYSYQGFGLDGIRLYSNGKLITVPQGSIVTAYATKGGTTGGTISQTFTVGESANGVVSSGTGDTALMCLLDNNAGTFWGWKNDNNTIPNDGASNPSPTFKITIEFSASVPMPTSYSLASSDSSYRNPKSWTFSVMEASGTSWTQLHTGSNLGGTTSWSSYSVNYSGASSSSIDVAAGGTLYLKGNAGAKVTLADGARLAVTNASCLTVSKGLTLDGKVKLDVSEAGKFGWTEVMSGAGLAAADIYKFELLSDAAAAKISGGSLFVATEGIIQGPYARTLGDSTNSWNTATWTANGTGFTKSWADEVTLPTGEVRLDVSGDATLNVDTAVNVGTVVVTNSMGSASTLTVIGAGSLVASTLDFSGYNGKVVWSPDIAGASVICGTNDVTLLNGDGATLTVSAGGIAHIAGTFTTYANDADSRVDFIGTGRALDMGSVPSQGTLSFQGATLTGGYQNTALTYLVEDGDTVVMNARSDSMSARNTGSFDIRGGSLTVNPGSGAWWFGDNGHSSFKMSGGSFTCTANGTGTSGSGSGLLIGFMADVSFPIALDISGGVFAVPNSSLNFYNPATMTVSGGRVRAKGVFAGSSNVGNLNVNAGGVFEVGSIGLCANAVDCNLNGGMLASFETTQLKGAVNVDGAGTLAAANGTTLAAKGGLTGNGSLTIGATNYAGTVKLTAIPAGITNLVVNAGTLHLGLCRPVTKTLGASDGAVAITLSNTQIRNAKTTSVKIIKAATVPKGGVLVYSAKGDLQTETVAAIENGFLTVKTTHDNMFKTETGLKWGNIGDADNRIATKADQAGFYGNAKTWTLNLTNTVNMSASSIGPEGKFVITSMRFFGRKGNDKAAPTSVTLKQGSVTAVSTSAKNTAGGGTLYVVGGSSQTYGLNVFTFDDAVAFDPSQNITMTFEPSGSEIGYGMMLPANTLFYHSFSTGNFSPIVEITGDWTHESDEPAVDDVGGDSVSINVIGGNANSRTGKSIASGAAGKYPVAVAGWNQLAERSDNSAFSENAANLTEVRMDGSIETSAMSATLSGSCTYTSGQTASNADAELEYGYIDDGNTGARIVVENIPYSQYDVYVYMGSDQTDTSKQFGPVSVTSGNFTTNYPAANTAWGSAVATHGAVTLTEGQNCFRIAGLSGSSVIVNGSTKDAPSGTRCGIAGVQIVNTGVRQEIYTWKGESEGVWSQEAANWISPEGASTAWPGAGEALVAKFTDDAMVRLEGEVVAPTVKFEIPDETATFADYIPTTSTKLFEGVQLSEVVAFAGQLAGAWIANGAASVYHISRTDTLATMQFQKADDGYVKCAKLELTQQGDDIYGRVLWSKNDKQSGSIGMDFDATTNLDTANTPTTDDGKGYGIKGLTITIARRGKLAIDNAGGLEGELTMANGRLALKSGEISANLTMGGDATLELTGLELGDVIATFGTLTGVTADFANVTINGAAVSTNDYELVGGTFKDKRVPAELTAPFTAKLSGTMAFEDLTWIDNYGRYWPSEQTAPTDKALQIVAAEAATLVITNEIAVSSIAVSGNVTVKLVADGEALAKNASLGHPFTKKMINGSAAGIVADDLILPNVPAAYEIAPLADASGLGFTITEKALIEPYHADLADGGNFTDLVWKDYYGRVVSSDNAHLVISVPTDMTLVISNDVQLMNLATAGDGVLTLKFMKEGKLTTESGLSGNILIDASGLDMTSLANTIEYPNAVTNWLIVGSTPANLDFTENGLPPVPAGKLIAATDDNKGYVISAVPPIAKHFEVTFNDFWEAFDWQDFSMFNWDGDAYEPGKQNTATINIEGDIPVYFDRALTLDTLTIEGRDGGYDDRHWATIQLSDATNFDNVGKLILRDADTYSYTYGFGCDIEIGEGSRLTVYPEEDITAFLITSKRILGANASQIQINGMSPSEAGWKPNTAGNGFVKMIPTITDNGGEIAVNPTNATEYIVSTNGVRPSITVTDAGNHTIVVPPSVTNVIGVAAEKILVRYGKYDITSAFEKNGDALAGVILRLDANAKVTVSTEVIPVTPKLSHVTGDNHVIMQPFAATDDKVAVGVKSIPGLTYRLMRGTELGTYGHKADSTRAESSRIILKDNDKPKNKAFYVIEVTNGN